MTDLCVGNWHGGLDVALAGEVALIEQRRLQGFRLLPYESTVSELALLLDGYDAITEEILTEDCGCCTETMPLPFEDLVVTGQDKFLLSDIDAPTDEKVVLPNNYTQERKASRKK